MTIYRSLGPQECACRSDKYVLKLFAENLLSQEWTQQVIVWLAWMYSEHLLILWTCFKCVSSSPQLHIEISAYIIFPYKPFTRSIWNFQMKAMEEEVLIKNGEIKILRDSLHQTESILEEQRRSHFLLEQEKTQALSEKEKEFSKKVTQRYVLLVWTSALPAY